MIVQVEEQVAALPQPLLEPGALLLVEFNDFLVDGPLDLAHTSRIPARPGARCVWLPAAYGSRAARSSERRCSKRAMTTSAASGSPPSRPSSNGMSLK